MDPPTGSSVYLGHHTLQLFEPILDDDHAGRRRAPVVHGSVFQHEKPFAICGHVVMPGGVWLGILGVQNLRWPTRPERLPRGGDWQAREHPSCIKVEQYTARPFGEISAKSPGTCVFTSRTGA